MTDRPDRVTVATQAADYHAKTTVPADWGKKLSHIAADLGIPKHELLRQAVGLLLRHHGFDAPDPTPPVKTTRATAGATP